MRTCQGHVQSKGGTDTVGEESEKVKLQKVNWSEQMFFKHPSDTKVEFFLWAMFSMNRMEAENICLQPSINGKNHFLWMDPWIIIG